MNPVQSYRPRLPAAPLPFARLPPPPSPETKTKGVSAPRTGQRLGHDPRSSFAAALDSRPAFPGAPSSKEEALRNAETVLNPEVNTQNPGESHEVTRDGKDELGAGVGDNFTAAMQVAANSQLEQDSLEGMSPAAQQQYQEVKQAIGRSPDAGIGQLALQKMLFSGRLPGDKALRGEGSTLDQLAHAASGADLAEGLDASEFTGSLTRELATPSSINQGARGTCAPTALSIDLARRNPAEYARIVNGLASKSGEVTLADGRTTLQREPETSFADDNSGRSVVQRILAPALMEVTNGDRDYNDATGENAGTLPQDLATLDNAIHGEQRWFRSVGTPEQRAEAMTLIDQELARGNGVLVGMDYANPGSAPGYHELLVTGTSQQGGEQYVEYTNPWGREERMKRADFESRMISVNYKGLPLKDMLKAFQRPLLASRAEAVPFI